LNTQTIGHRQKLFQLALAYFAVGLPGRHKWQTLPINPLARRNSSGPGPVN
jgi:hypothetical protein